jgi:hypothetical protein
VSLAVIQCSAASLSVDSQKHRRIVRLAFRSKTPRPPLLLTQTIHEVLLEDWKSEGSDCPGKIIMGVTLTERCWG